MIKYVYDECNIINHMIDVGMVDMNYIINGWMFLQMCFKRWNVVQYVEWLNWFIKIFFFKWIIFIIYYIPFEHGCTPYGITNFVLSNFTTMSNVKKLFFCVWNVKMNMQHQYMENMLFINHQCIWKHL